MHRANYECYGYLRVWHDLRRQGVDVGRDRVARLMRQAGLRGAKRRGNPPRTTRRAARAPERPDLVERRFAAGAPNRLWLADLTLLRCWELQLYLAFVIDLYSRMVIGWQLASHMRTDIVLDALKMAVGIRGPGADVGLVIHSDRARNTPVWRTRRRSMTSASRSRSAASATPWRAPRPNPGWTR